MLKLFFSFHVSGRERATKLIITTAITMMLSAVCNVQSAKAISLNSAERAQLKRGDVVQRIRKGSNGSTAVVDAVVHIPKAPDLVWSIMTDCARAAIYLDTLKSCRILKVAKDGSWDVREHHVKPALLLPETRSVFRSDYRAPKEIRFRRIAGDLRSLVGTWKLLPVSSGKGTVLVYHAEIGLDLPLPAFMIHSAIVNSLTTALLSLKQEVVKNAR